MAQGTPVSERQDQSVTARHGAMDPVKLGFIGCGHISGEYFESCALYREVEVLACADLARSLAEQQAERYEIPKVETPEELLADPDVEIVVNLTPPAVHADVTLAAIGAGKHVYTEKPFAPTLELAGQIVAAAREADVSVGCAPATFMSGAFQTARKLIDDGWIGEPTAATAFFTNRGYEYWHPNIDPFYSPGGGPMLDIGRFASLRSPNASPRLGRGRAAVVAPVISTSGSPPMPRGTSSSCPAPWPPLSLAGRCGRRGCRLSRCTALRAR